MSTKTITLQDVYEGQQAMQMTLKDVVIRLHELTLGQCGLARGLSELGAYTESGFDTMNGRFDRIEDQADRLDAKVDGLDAGPSFYEH